MRRRRGLRCSMRTPIARSSESSSASASAAFNPDRRTLLEAREALEADVSGDPDPVARNEEEKAISLYELERVLVAASDATTDAFERLRDTWFEKLLGPERDAQPSNAHVHYLRRLSPLESTYTKDGAVDICLASTLALGFDMTAIPNIRLDLEDRPQKNPRACVIPSNPPEVVHLITRAQGGVSDYQAFMHEAGHALHYAGVDPRLPFTFRSISRDHALTEIYSYIFEAVTREPGWHALHFGLSDAQAEENAQATLFLEALLYRRYTAKLRYELGFWSAFAEERGQLRARLLVGADERDRHSLRPAELSRRHGRGVLLRRLPPRVDPLGPAAHLPLREVGDDWWRSEATGEILRDLFLEGTRPTSEEMAGRLGFDPLDTGAARRGSLGRLTALQEQSVDLLRQLRDFLGQLLVLLRDLRVRLQQRDELLGLASSSRCSSPVWRLSILSPWTLSRSA